MRAATAMAWRERPALQILRKTNTASALIHDLTTRRDSETAHAGMSVKKGAAAKKRKQRDEADGDDGDGAAAAMGIADLEAAALARLGGGK